jgi:hypothetical protein
MNWHHYHEAGSIWIASSLRADMIFGKDRSFHQVVERLARLNGDVALNNSARRRIERTLARHEQHVAEPNGLCER